MKNGAPYDISLAVNLHIEEFAGAVITKVESGSTNLILDQYSDGRWYTTQRPGINQLEDCSASITDARGRGCYYWDAVNDKYIVNNDTVYKGSYAGTTMAISAGTERVFIDTVGEFLVIIDQENDEGWYITKAAPTVINAIADLDFPANQTPALSLARGGAVLNGKLYVLTTGAEIYECEVEDPTSWNPLNVRNSEVEPDDGVYMDKIDEHIVVLGTRSCEFFQDVANPTGSTLAARTDISYQVGSIDADSSWRLGDSLYFAGQDRSNSIAVYKLQGLMLSAISGEDMSTFLTTAITKDLAGVTGSGFTSGQRDFFALTVHFTTTDIEPNETLVFSSKRGMWGIWDVALPGVDNFPLVSWMPSTNTRAGEGVLINGDLVTVLDDFSPVDTVAPTAVFEADVFDVGVFTATAASGTSIPFEVITGVVDGNTVLVKRMSEMWAVGTPIDVQEDITISFADEQNTTYDVAGTIDVSDVNDRLARLGAFRRRNTKISGALSKQWRAEKLQVFMRAG